MIYNYIIVLFLCLFLFVTILLNYFYNVNKNDSCLKISYIDSSIFLTSNITNNDWCSIEIESYLMMFFLCHERIPNIGKFLF